jgi:hypothetical protein
MRRRREEQENDNERRCPHAASLTRELRIS